MTTPSAVAAGGQGQIDELVCCMEELVEAVSRLVRLAEEKQQLIMRRDGPGLTALVEEQGRAAETLGRIEERRALLAERAGWTTDDPDRWLAGVAPPAREQIAGALAALRDLKSRLAEQHAVNEKLLEEELAYIRFALDVLEGPQAADVTYGPNAKEGLAGGRGERALFDFKV